MRSGFLFFILGVIIYFSVSYMWDKDDFHSFNQIINLEVDPQFGIHKAVKTIKGRTSRVLRTEFPWLRSRISTLWTNSYFVSTVGDAPLAMVKQYIENQKISQRG